MGGCRHATITAPKHEVQQLGPSKTPKPRSIPILFPSLSPQSHISIHSNHLDNAWPHIFSMRQRSCPTLICTQQDMDCPFTHPTSIRTPPAHAPPRPRAAPPPPSPPPRLYRIPWDMSVPKYHRRQCPARYLMCRQPYQIQPRVSPILPTQVT